MRNRGAAGAVLLALVLLAVGFRMLFGGGPVGETPVVPPPLPATPADGEEPPPASAPSPEEVAHATPSRPDAPARWLLEGTLVDFHPPHGTRAAVEAYPLRRTDVEKPTPLPGSAGEDGRFTIDFTDLMRGPDAPEAFVILVDHPEYVRAGCDRDIPWAAGEGGTGDRVVRCSIPMTPAVRADVRVRDPGGNPVAGAAVGLFLRSEESGLPQSHSEDTATTDAAGGAILRAAKDCGYLVVAAAGTWLPGSAHATGGAEGTVDIALVKGETVEGRVTRDGRPVEGVPMAATPDETALLTLRLEDLEIRTVNASLARASVGATTGPDGRYRLEGLTGDPWRIAVGKVPGREDLMGFMQVVLPSESGIDFSLETGEIILEARSGGRPVSGVRVQVFCAGAAPFVETDADGRAVVSLPPESPFGIQTSADGYVETRSNGTAPGAGLREVFPVELVPVPSRGALVVILRDAGGRPLSTAGFRFADPAGDLAAAPWRLQEPSRDGRFRIEDMDPGRYRMTIRPGRNGDPDFTWDGEGGTWLDASLDVEVPAEGEREVSVTAVAGGRLRIGARGPDRAFLPLPCRIRDTAGGDVPGLFAERYGMGGAYSLREGTLGDRALSDLCGALPPGVYRITVEGGKGVEKVRDVTLPAGRITTAEFHLSEAELPENRTVPVPAGGGR